MSKRFFELSLIVFFFFWTIYLVLYTFFLDDICDKYSNSKTEISNSLTNHYFKNSNVVNNDLIGKMSSCTDMFVCEPSSIKREKNTKITDWKCTKKRIDYFDYHYYVKKIKILNFKL